MVQRSEGSWSLWIELGSDASGKRRQKTVTVRGTKRDAQRELNRILHELDTGSFVDPAKMTVAQYLERWLADYAKVNVSPKTYEGYEEFIRVHLVPAFGAHPLPKLTPLHIQNYYSRALQTGRRDGKGGLSARTVLHHHRVLREALQLAVRWQLLVRNPADAVEPPRPEKKEMQVLNADQIGHLLSVASRTRLYVPVLLAVATGMRRGEVLGLRWQDVDLKNGMLSIRQSLQQTKEGTSFKQPKTQKSRRMVALPPSVVEELRRHQAAQTDQRQLMEGGYQNHDLVVAHPDGCPFSPGGLTHAFADLIAGTGLPRVRLHDLRHSHATHLFREGVHPKIVSERLGHATVGITLDVYSHVLPGMQAEAALRIDAALRRPPEVDGERLEVSPGVID